VANFIVRKAAVLGAGVMGAQIAAHFVNARIPVVLFDLAPREGPKSGIVRKAIEALAKLSPAPLAEAALAAHIEACNYDEDLEKLRTCDLIIEAIAERMDLKLDLYRKIAPYVRAGAIVASNTSGLSITTLADSLPPEERPRFCGVHFFNPPRYMYLVELIASPHTDPRVLDDLEQFLTSSTGKGIIRAKDTPNFVANRFGVFSMLATMANAAKFGLGFDVVDDLTGTRLGRPKSATFRTADVVGLDTLVHVIRTMAETLPDDPWHPLFKAPAWLAALIQKGALGQKTRAGVYSKPGKDVLVLDLAKQDYVPATGAASARVKDILKMKSVAERFAAMRADSDPQAQFLWAIQRDLFHYCAYHLSAVADNARDVDLALRWGFGWSLGPFEVWQAAGWQQVASWIAEDIREGRTLANAPLPAWAADAKRSGVHAPDGSYSAGTATLVPPSSLPVYRRQLFPPQVLGEKPVGRGATIAENEAVRLWTDTNEPNGDDIAIVSFKTKMHTVSEMVLDGVLQAVATAEERFKGLVIWQPDEPFSFGADLASLAPALMQGRFDLIEQVVAKFQQTSMALKYAQVPTVAAVRGMALGGGTEFAMHCTRVVAALESYIGLVEVGVGLIPAGGGCKEFALRCAQEAMGTAYVLDFLKGVFQTVAMANVAKSAQEARTLGFLRTEDVIALNTNEVLFLAKQNARQLYSNGYRPPLKTKGFPVLGSSGIATIEAQLVNMRDGGYISMHDFNIGLALAEALCGGYVDAGSLVDERWILEIERRQFMALLKNPLTQARIQHTLTTGQPLRN
jgi:3-hydroxyacyl-CoA dehydrogenase